MSHGPQADDSSTESSNTKHSGIESIEANRDALETLAESDLPVADYARILLDVADADVEAGR